MHREQLEDLLAASNSNRDYWQNMTEHYRFRLRDKFATAALNGFVSYYENMQNIARHNGYDKSPAEHAAKLAYMYADAMMKERG